ncbi:DNA polymerase ligase N-terminal domain-containing protein [uncultured Chryseobacterium sp.]|uniref:DNA polymerase ligase N-terminal domain-containing protein n=1 Tax=uncultured Chryseobacterium sp. TaxID=259322 RepID=UPI0027DB7EF8|nr:DNA polymerase ligase N-terminal domain-containing protein [uncultured Chryseobacterium sp.]
MALKDYNQKRKFDETSEPKGKTKKSKEQLIFVIQRHAASRLHYDFRLEMDGVLKSWAVPKGPSLDPKDKRLAMMVEDHPYDYKDFEGNIPEGNYGAGQVEIWDSGTYEPLDNHSKLSDEKELLKELHAGSLKFILHGKKLKGEFALVKMKNTEENSWLLIKHKDDFAESDYDAEENTAKNSQVTKFLEEKKSLKSSKKKSQPQK